MNIEHILSAVTELCTSPWLWLILIASLMYAAGNYIDELLLSKYEQEVGTMVIISTLFGGVVVTVFVVLAYVFDAKLLLDTPIIFQALLIGALEALWVIPYLYATERSGALVAGPLFQAVPVFALVLESFYGIIPPPLQLLGAMVIVLGGILISIEKEEDAAGITSHKIDWTTIFLMTISVVLVAVIYVLFRDAAIATNFIGVGFWVGLGTLLTGIVIYTTWKPYRQQFNDFCSNANYKAVGIQFGNEILDAGGAYLTNLATVMGPSVMVVTAFNATQPVFIGLIGFALATLGIAGTSTSRTQGSGWKLVVIAIILISLGVIILSLGSG